MVIILVTTCGFCLALCINVFSVPFDVAFPSFEQSDLYGVWETRYSDCCSDKLIIYSDGYFEQEYKNNSDYEYISDRNPWFLERFSDGRIYLHLTNGRYYHSGSSFFENVGNKPSFTLYDPFSNTIVQMNGELILVLAHNKSRQFVLLHLLLGPDFGFPLFELGTHYFLKK